MLEFPGVRLRWSQGFVDINSVTLIRTGNDALILLAEAFDA